jgi:hypothetical protein
MMYYKVDCAVTFSERLTLRSGSAAGVEVMARMLLAKRVRENPNWIGYNIISIKPLGM